MHLPGTRCSQQTSKEADPWAGLNLEVGKMNYGLGKQAPNMQNVPKVLKTFQPWNGQKHYMFACVFAVCFLCLPVCATAQLKWQKPWPPDPGQVRSWGRSRFCWCQHYLAPLVAPACLWEHWEETQPTEGQENRSTARLAAALALV